MSDSGEPTEPEPEAAEDAAELHQTIAELEAALVEARAGATAELEDAKRRGREMVAEAQLVRRRILEDLARRRRNLRRQIEQLRAGRERLLEAYEVVGHAVEEATQELNVALPEARAAAERAGRRVGPEESVESLEEEIEAARVAGLPILDPPPTTLAEVEPVVAAFEEVRVLGPVGHAADDDGGQDVEPEAAPEPEPEPEHQEPAEVLQLFDRIRAAADEPEPATDDQADANVLAFVEPPLEAELEGLGDDEPAPEPVQEDPVAVLADDLSRRLRRSLADEQNRVLDRLRQDRKGQLGVDELLGDADARVARLATAIEPSLVEAAGEAGHDAPVAELAARLAAEVADGVRAEVDSRLGDDTDGEGLARPLREAFREWRTDRILPLATGVAAEAVGRG